MSTATEKAHRADDATPEIPARRGPALRTDIQGLRAIAVSIVLIYHLAPHALPGGFVGVDVFFVISGFLITSHLLSRPPGNGRDLLGFWSRRIRRLLPASLLVLTATLAGTRLFAPDTQWSNTAAQIRGAALYVVNWQLARDSVDYLASENAPTAVQHFWSLSVEEQFYFVWPIAILLLVWLARRLRARLAVVVGTGLGLIVAASLAYSIHETASNPPAAYFVTPTRMWELGVGGVLALLTAPRALGRDDFPRVPPAWLARALAWAGLAMIAWTCWAYSGDTRFPGYAAAVPVLGTAFVIAGHPRGDDRGSPGGLLALRPVQWLGDVSYSVYLWHWPLVVLVPYATGHGLNDLDRAGIVLATLVLAGLTKRYVEDRFRTPRWGRPLLKPYALAVVGMAIVVGLASLQIGEVRHREADARVALKKALSGHDPCFGAAALDPGKSCAQVPYDKILPAPVDAANDKSNAYAAVSGKRDCWSYLPEYPVKTCIRGDRSGTTTIALVGNSHAGEWLPALERIARQRHWKIVTYLASRCAFADVPQVFDTSANSAACSAWVTNTARAIAAAHPDAVLMANRISVAAVGHSFAGSQSAYQTGYEKVLRTLARARLKTLVLHDSPAPLFSIPDCVAEKQGDYTACDGTRAKWLPQEPAQAAVRAVGDPDIRFADLTDHICGPTVCSAVTGGVVTYFDGSHLTATFAATLAPYLEKPLVRLVDGQ